jgi:hypothetical protein
MKSFSSPGANQIIIILRFHPTLIRTSTPPSSSPLYE